MDNDLISREALKEEISKNKKVAGRFIEGVLMLIDNAPTVKSEKAKESEIIKAYTKGFDTGVETVKNERPQGDLISRDQVLHEIGQLSLAWEYGQGVADCHAIIENALAVESRPKGEYTEEDMKRTIKENFDIGYEMAKNKYGRPQGEWGKWVISEIQCPNCFEYFETDCYSTEELKKCPNCGADMKGGAE